MNVYDFDDTIYDGESCFDFFLFYLKKRPKLILSLPSVIRAFSEYKRGRVTLESAIEDYAPKVESFFASIEDPYADAREFWDRRMKKIKPFYLSQQREDDLIITASPSFSIEEVCRRLGIKHFIASDVDIKTGKILLFCMRTNKTKAFFERYPDAHIENFYTDSPENDAPLIEIADRAFVVTGHDVKRIK